MFFKIESWNFQVQFEIKIRETSQTFNSFSFFRQLLFSSFFIRCLIELKFCKVSWNSISKWTWKFQLSILKNKKVLFLKKNFFGPLSISKQKNFVYWLNFKEGFGLNTRKPTVSIKMTHSKLGSSEDISSNPPLRTENFVF